MVEVEQENNFIIQNNFIVFVRNQNMNLAFLGMQIDKIIGIGGF